MTERNPDGFIRRYHRVLLLVFFVTAAAAA
jgi:hypothetical protein